MGLKIEVDREADAASVELPGPHGRYSHTIDVDGASSMDLDEDGRAIRMEFLYISDGVYIPPHVRHGVIAEALRSEGVTVLTARPACREVGHAGP